MPISLGGRLGSFFGGFAQGAESGMKLDLQGQQLAQQRALKDQAARDKMQARYKDIGNTLYEAFLSPDEATRNTVVDAVIAEVEQLRGKPLSKPFVSWLRKNPQDAAAVLENTAQQGVSPAVLFNLADDPLLLSTGLLAFGKAKAEREARIARSGGGDLPGAAPAPTALGGGVRLGGVSIPRGMEDDGDKTHATGGTPTIPALEADLRRRILGLTVQINTLAGQGRSEQKEVKPLRDERIALEKQLFDLTAGRAMKVEEERRGEQRKIAEEGRQPISPAEAQSLRDELNDAGRRDLARRVVTNMPRSAAMELRKALEGTVREFAPTEPQALARVRELAERGVASTVTVDREPAITTPEKEAEREEMQRRAKPLTPEFLRDNPDIAKRGILTQGQLEDARTDGRLPIRSLEDLETIRNRIRETEQLATKTMDGIRKAGQLSAEALESLKLIATVAGRLGPTGQWVTPVRQMAFNAAQLLGVQNPGRLGELQLVDSLNMRLALRNLERIGGNDSDKEMLKQVLSNPSALQSPHGRMLMIVAGVHFEKMAVERMVQAERWRSQHGSIEARDSDGETFTEVFQRDIANKNSALTRAALEVGVDLGELKKGRIVPKAKGR